MRRRWEAQGGSRELVYDVALWGFPAGDRRRPPLLPRHHARGPSFDHWWGPFAVWHGGLGIWGGIALGTLVGIWRVHRAGADIPAVPRRGRARRCSSRRRSGASATTSTRSCSGGRATSRGRSRSTPSTGPRAYLADPTFHPTFLYELLWNLLLAAALVWLGRHRDDPAARSSSRSTSPATAPSGSSTSSCGSTPRRTCSGCAGTWCSHARERYRPCLVRREPAPGLEQAELVADATPRRGARRELAQTAATWWSTARGESTSRSAISALRNPPRPTPAPPARGRLARPGWRASCAAGRAARAPRARAAERASRTEGTAPSRSNRSALRTSSALSTLRAPGASYGQRAAPALGACSAHRRSAAASRAARAAPRVRSARVRLWSARSPR